MNRLSAFNLASAIQPHPNEILRHVASPMVQVAIARTLLANVDPLGSGEEAKPERIMIDSTHLKAHRTAASLLKRGCFPAVTAARKAG
jgi:hypothetical protein